MSLENIGRVSLNIDSSNNSTSVSSTREVEILVDDADNDGRLNHNEQIRARFTGTSQYLSGDQLNQALRLAGITQRTHPDAPVQTLRQHIAIHRLTAFMQNNNPSIETINQMVDLLIHITVDSENRGQIETLGSRLFGILSEKAQAELNTTPVDVGTLGRTRTYLRLMDTIEKADITRGATHIEIVNYELIRELNTRMAEQELTIAQRDPSGNVAFAYAEIHMRDSIQFYSDRRAFIELDSARNFLEDLPHEAYVGPNSNRIEPTLNTINQRLFRLRQTFARDFVTVARSFNQLPNTH